MTEVQARALSGGHAVAVEQSGTFAQQMVALGFVVLFATFGGIVVQILMKGLTFQTGKVGPVKIPNVTDKVAIPPLVGMIIMGCICRNFFCTDYMMHYPEATAGRLRSVCLSIILLRGGMELDFTGKGLTVVLLTLCPQVCEALMSGIATYFIFGMPWPLCVCMGFCLGAVSPAVLVPSLMILQKNGYGVKKGIPTTLIAASSFDDIIAITVFGVFLTVAINEAPGGIAEESDSVWFELAFVGLQVIVGLAVGLSVGYMMKCFVGCPSDRTKWPKFFLTLAMAIATPVVCEMTGFIESKFICIIFFGFMCYRVWGEDKPEHELGIFWMFVQPVLFGSVGAAVLFEKLEPSLMLQSLACITIGVTSRWLATFMATCEKKYNYKERAFMAFAWIPKATVQAALGGQLLMIA
jgi:solute carrier family 9B (sodium/hydrogen exchanger), member 1/2